MKKQLFFSLFITLVITYNTFSMISNLSAEEIEQQRIAINTALRLNPKEKFTGPNWEHIDKGLIELCKEHRTSEDSTVIRGTGSSFNQSKKTEEKETHYTCAEIREYKKKKNLKKINPNKPNDPKITSNEVLLNEINKTPKIPANLDQTNNTGWNTRNHVPQEGSSNQPEISSPSNLQVFLLAAAILTPLLGIMGYIWYTKIKKPKNEPKPEPKRWHEKVVSFF